MGAKNYKSFLVMIVSVFLQMCTFITHGILLSILVPENESGILEKKVIAWVYMAIIVVFTFLLLNLIMLHIYLICTDQTTFDFLVSMKKAEQKKEQERIEL